jgi:hypothetical protein
MAGARYPKTMEFVKKALDIFGFNSKFIDLMGEDSRKGPYYRVKLGVARDVEQRDRILSELELTAKDEGIADKVHIGLQGINQSIGFKVYVRDFENDVEARRASLLAPSPVTKTFMIRLQQACDYLNKGNVYWASFFEKYFPDVLKKTRDWTPEMLQNTIFIDKRFPGRTFEFKTYALHSLHAPIVLKSIDSGYLSNYDDKEIFLNMSYQDKQ